MAHPSGIHIGRHARALTAALLLGTAVLSFVPGQTAHAARAILTEADGSDSGGGPQGDPGTPGTSERNNGGSGVRCTTKNADGSTKYHRPGETVTYKNGMKFKCGRDGKWHQVRLAADPTSSQAPEGGVYSPAP
jgi:hypothetical protein